ncbi:MAG: patatin-like phospholipase family protein, partial [Candidatus Solibacter sp.]|nr:patatin-like phospholipase family protein [Candidatus Solibacter sp.]
VGGYFATGHSAAESREFIRSIDWSSVFSASAPYENLLFRRKEDRRQFQNSLEFGLKGGFRLPSSLSSGNAVSLVISRIAAPYPDMASFSDLPIPFRCVAVDLIAGRSVVFDSGRLQTALRATMSIPAVFSPLPVGEKLFVDGGALNNLPVDVAQQMGAEYTIAVVLDGPPVDRKSLDNMFGVAARSISVMISDNELRNRKAANLVLAPDLKGLSGGDWRSR